MHVVLASHWYSSELEQIKTIIRCRSSYEKHTTFKTGVSSLKSKNWKPFLKHDFSSRQHISGLHRREKVSLLLPPPLAHSLQGYWLANFGVACLERTSVSVDFLPAKIHLFRHHNIKRIFSSPLENVLIFWLKIMNAGYQHSAWRNLEITEDVSFEIEQPHQTRIISSSTYE